MTGRIFVGISEDLTYDEETKPGTNGQNRVLCVFKKEDLKYKIPSSGRTSLNLKLRDN